jgi:hypothetical protein
MERRPNSQTRFHRDIPPSSLLLCDGLSLCKDPDFPSRILVPPALREALMRQHHADLNHVSHPKVLTSLARHYHWSSMKSDIRRFIQDCENEKGKRRLAHDMFSGDNTDKPRSRYSVLSPWCLGFPRPRQSYLRRNQSSRHHHSIVSPKPCPSWPYPTAKQPLWHPAYLMRFSFDAVPRILSTAMKPRNSCLSFSPNSPLPQAPHAQQPAGITPKPMAKLNVGGATGIAR